MIRNLCKEINPDVIVSFGNVCNTNVIPSLIGTNYKTIVCERNDPNYDPRSRVSRNIRNQLYFFADGYVFQTEKIRDYFAYAIRKNAAVIPNPVEPTTIKWDLSQCTKSIVTVARLDDYQKNHTLLIRAFTRVLEKHPDYKLKIYGDGPDKEKYNKLIDSLHMKDNVQLMGKTSNALAAICESEIFILTSRYEGMPNALMEALSVGMPCISTDCGGGGARVLFELTNSGYLVKHDEESIANALNELIENQKLKLLFSREALKINDVLSIGEIAKEWIQYIGSVAEQKKK